MWGSLVDHRSGGQQGSSGFTGFVKDQESRAVDELSGSAEGAAAPESGPQNSATPAR